MKMSIPTVRILAGFGLAASLFWACENPLNQDKGEVVTTVDETALRLSIKDDAACREQWSAILAARTDGHPDSGTEVAFLSRCVTEVKPGKDKTPPVIPPDLVPDSTSRCRWIVAQIEGGRREMTVTYKRYCPASSFCGDLLRKLSLVDSASPEYFHLKEIYLKECAMRPGIPPKDTLVHLPKDTVGIPVKPLPVDTMPKPIPAAPNAECEALRAHLAKLDPASQDYAKLKVRLKEHCPETLR